jgi:hypothetical protein
VDLLKLIKVFELYPKVRGSHRIILNLKVSSSHLGKFEEVED